MPATDASDRYTIAMGFNRMIAGIKLRGQIARRFLCDGCVVTLIISRILLFYFVWSHIYCKATQSKKVRMISIST